jgi:hypothetical protein
VSIDWCIGARARARVHTHTHTHTHACLTSDFGVEDKLLGYAERAAASSLQGSVPGVWGKLQKLWYL